MAGGNSDLFLGGLRPHPCPLGKDHLRELRPSEHITVRTSARSAMYCPACGLHRPGPHRYCVACGTRLPHELASEQLPKVRMFLGIQPTRSIRRHRSCA
jgi:hypothetical protein